MKEYKYPPHSANRVWTIMNDYDKWAEFAKPMVISFEVVKPGDGKGNDLIRRVNYKLPLGLRGTSIEIVHDVQLGVSYTYTTIKGTVGKIRLEELSSNKTRLHFKEKLELENALWLV